MTSIIKNARESELKQNATQVQVNETTLPQYGFAHAQKPRQQI